MLPREPMTVLDLVFLALVLLLVCLGAAIFWCAVDLYRAYRHQNGWRDLRVLMLLAERGPLTGLELVHAGAGRRGTLYVRLNLLEDRGLVVSEEVPPPAGVIALPQRLYTITDRGRAALNLRPGAQR